jgi:hypothetical protein
VGNLDQESNDDPNAVQQGGPGRGIAQWSVGGRWDTATNDNVLWYASKQGEASSSLQLQLEFIWYELTTFPEYGLAALQKTTDVTNATVAFETDFEGCGACDEAARIAYAQAALAAYGSSVAHDAGHGDAATAADGGGEHGDGATTTSDGAASGADDAGATPVTRDGGVWAGAGGARGSGGCGVAAPGAGDVTTWSVALCAAVAFARAARRRRSA